MVKLNKQELFEVKGGAIKWGIAALIFGGLTFLIGVIDGYIRPFKCRT